MGVTLERVQNKFACIIGELCSEPVVLSQFAIWLDLRLAEYKAKGAISLDCSGDNPDPVWLNGHRLPQKRPTSRDRHYGTGSPGPQPGEMSWSRISAERNSQSPGYDRTESVGERLSPSAVKTEPLDHGGMGAYPVSLHAHELSESRTPPRKRSAAETISSEHELLSSGSKSRRLSHDPNSTADPSSNQSLMSIISGEVQEHDPETVDLTDSDMSMIMNYEDRQSTSQTSRGENSRPSYTSTPSATAGSEFAARSDDSLNTDYWKSPQAKPKSLLRVLHNLEERQMVALREMQAKFSKKDSCLYSSFYPDRLQTSEIRKRMVGVDKMSSHGAMNLVNAVCTLERWWWKKYEEERRVEDMSASDLNGYLEEFYTILRRPDGREYSPDSVANFRSFLHRFLKDHGWTKTLNKSPEFESSNQVLAEKRQWLSVLSGSLSSQLLG